jgi:amino acid adenylation domain-containing protein
VLGEQEHVLLLTMHHIVSDGWSMGVLTQELSALYRAFAQGGEDPLAALSIQYADYAAWQRQWLEGEELQRQSAYWQRHLGGAPALLELPVDRPRPAQPDHCGGMLGIELDEALVAGLKTLGQRHGMTLYMTLLAAWAALLGRLSGQQEVVIATPVANRTRMEFEGLIGFFVNTLALRVDLSGAPTTQELLLRVKRVALDAQQHQDLPFEQVVDLLNPVRSLSHGPLCQASFTWQNNAPAEFELPGLQVQPRPPGTHQHMVKDDLGLRLGEAGGRIAGAIEYATALFDATTIERFAGCWERLLRAMVAGEQQPVERLDWLGEAERLRLVSEWNATGAESARGPCIHSMIEAHAAATPHATALVQEAQAISYQALNTQANRLAHYLRDCGVGPDVRVALCAQRRAPLIVGMLAVLKAGGAFVPLDPTYPGERLAFLLADSDPMVLLADAAGAKALRHLDLVCIRLDDGASAWADQPTDDPRPEDVELAGSHLAYVIYTSGSTGQPKGVMVEHRGVCNLAQAQVETLCVEPDSRVLQFASISFDASVFEMVSALTRGACLVLPEPGTMLAGQALLDTVRRHGITHATLPPAVLAALPEGARLDGVGTLVVAGEACPASVVDRFAPGRRFINAYGPTETTVWASWALCRAGEGAPSIGKPIANTRLYLLDAHGAPVPIGVAGELYIGGDGVARGYLNRPELTAERFLDDPFHGGRMYRTGDLARRRPDGNIDFLGRNDFQLKIHGFRIEPGEIEARLRLQPGIREAAVLAREHAPGEERLVAYCVCDGAFDAAALRAQLARTLPEHMIPAAFVSLEHLPLTPNGKLDRQALPAPDVAAGALRPYEAPLGETESILAELWRELLRLERVGRHDDFFQLGGHSLLAVTMIDRMRQAGLSVDVRALFIAPTLQAFAAAAEDTEITL